MASHKEPHHYLSANHLMRATYQQPGCCAPQRSGPQAHLVGTDTSQWLRMLVSPPGPGHPQGLQCGRETLTFGRASCQSPIIKIGQTPSPQLNCKDIVHLGSRQNACFCNTDDNGIFGAGGIIEKTNSKVGGFTEETHHSVYCGRV